MKILLTMKNSVIPSISKMISKTKVMMEGRLLGEALSGWRILIPTGEKDFFFLTQIEEEEIQVLTSIG